MQTTALDHWYGYMKSHDHKALWDLLHRLMGEQLAKP
jgi:hypothetical protein